MSTQTIRDLKLLARLDEVECVSVGAGDHAEGNAPEWSEIILSLKDESGGSLNVPLTRHDGELIIEVLWTVLHPQDNRANPVQRLWAELDDVMDFLVGVDDPEPEDKARAKALAEAIAMLTQPFSDEPDLDAVRAEAAERWEARQD